MESSMNIFQGIFCGFVHIYLIHLSSKITYYAVTNLSGILTDFSPVLRFIWKPVICFAM